MTTDDGFTRNAAAIQAQLRMAHDRRAKALANRDRAIANISIAKHNAAVHQETVDAENHCIDSLLDAMTDAQVQELEAMVQG